ncbi:Putative interferon alpha-inducible protein IFI6/IFI27 [Colletotrichum destructivum]|uniref:Interferon alpha-inducible protein IFI6/IFI27 n=1 Tax=Colletotrichum destructivum TaxID=34406 RepID=A0AAX4IHG8_9PEZI|nr:Putative interferon alpha-inducible protein IFI6/IFI27 [Colletotrichum destructivum]
MSRDNKPASEPEKLVETLPLHPDLLPGDEKQRATDGDGNGNAGNGYGWAYEKAKSWASENPGQVVRLAVGVAAMRAPAFVAGLLLGTAGFGAQGIAAGSAAAAAQAGIGNVAAGGVFATLQSARMGGNGAAVVNRVVQAGGAALFAKSGYDAFKQWASSEEKSTDRSASGHASTDE